MLGGTGFLGPAIVQAGLAAGHRFTLWNRGKSNPGLFPDVEQLRGQRRRPRPDKPNDPAQDLTALQGRKWDAVVDTSAYFTGEVEDVCKVLAGNVGQYVFISSLSVYRTLEQDATPVDERSPLCECADKYVASMGANYEFYGALKRYCEDAVAAAFPGAATLLRPGYIVGPGDPTDRFTYWPARFLRGGECLAPGAPDNELQFIDVRDLGALVVRLIEQGTTGADERGRLRRPHQHRRVPAHRQGHAEPRLHVHLGRRRVPRAERRLGLGRDGLLDADRQERPRQQPAGDRRRRALPADRGHDPWTPPRG